MTSLEEIVQAALAAPPHLKEDALRVLRGEAQVMDSEPPVPTEPYLTLKELAQRLGLSVPTLWRWNVPAHDLGGRRRYRVSEVQAYLASNDFQCRVAALRAERREKAVIKGAGNILPANFNEPPGSGNRGPKLRAGLKQAAPTS